jgi:hypothetical protein
MVNVGPAGIDVGWLIFMHQFFQSLADIFEMPASPSSARPPTSLRHTKVLVDSTLKISIGTSSTQVCVLQQ